MIMVIMIIEKPNFENKEMDEKFSFYYNTVLFEPICRKKIYVKDMKFPKKEGFLYLRYPLSVWAKVKIQYSSIYELIDTIKKGYKEIYSNPDKFGIWGHYISDLVIEGIEIFKDGDISLSIGS